MGAEIAGAIADGVASLGSNILNNAVNWRIAQENRNLTRETNAQNESLMREAWARDDTARQRMVQDLEAAGLSKWLAAGASPMTSSPISLTAPQNDYKADFKGDFLDKALSAYQNVQYIAQTEAQTKNLQDQNKLLSEQIKEASSRAALAAHDVKVYEHRPDVATNDNATMKMFAEALNQLTNKDSTTSKILDSFGIGTSVSPEEKEAQFVNYIDNIFGEGTSEQILHEAAAKAVAKLHKKSVQGNSAYLNANARKLRSTNTQTYPKNFKGQGKREPTLKERLFPWTYKD